MMSQYHPVFCCSACVMSQYGFVSCSYGHVVLEVLLCMQRLCWYDVTKLLCIVTVLILYNSNVLHSVALLIYHSTVCVL